MASIHVLNVDRRVTNLSVSMSFGLDIGATDLDTFMEQSTELSVQMLNNVVLVIENDSRTFQILNLNIPDIYDKLYFLINAAAFPVLTRENMVVTFWENDSRQDSLGLQKIRDVRLP